MCLQNCPAPEGPKIVALRCILERECPSAFRQPLSSALYATETNLSTKTKSKALKETKGLRAYLKRTFPAGCNNRRSLKKICSKLSLKNIGQGNQLLRHCMPVGLWRGVTVRPPTMAALMLFGRNPLRWHQRCGIDFVRWEGKERKSGAELTSLKRFSVEAPLSALIERAFDSIKPFIRERQKLHDLLFSTKSLNIPPSLGRKPSSTRLLSETTVIRGLGIEVWMLKTAWKSVAPDCHPALLLWRHWPNVSI